MGRLADCGIDVGLHETISTHSQTLPVYIIFLHWRWFEGQCRHYIYTYLDPAKDVFFSGEGNFQAKLKKPTQQTVLVSIFVTSALFFVTSASFWRHVFYREFAACFCVMFSGETEKRHRFRVQVYTMRFQQPLYIYIYSFSSQRTWVLQNQYINLYMHICSMVFEVYSYGIYIYIYADRERERESEKVWD